MGIVDDHEQGGVLQKVGEQRGHGFKQGQAGIDRGGGGRAGGLARSAYPARGDALDQRAGPTVFRGQVLEPGRERRKQATPYEKRRPVLTFPAAGAPDHCAAVVGAIGKARRERGLAHTRGADQVAHAGAGVIGQGFVELRQLPAAAHEGRAVASRSGWRLFAVVGHWSELFPGLYRRGRAVGSNYRRWQETGAHCPAISCTDTRRSCLGPSSSTSIRACQVPSSSSPSTTGTVSDGPSIEARM